MNRDLPLLVLLMTLASVVFSTADGSATPPPAREVVQWEPHEIRLTANQDHPWWNFPATVAFTHPSSSVRLELEAYWDGDREWVVRFAPPLPGKWNWTAVSNDAGLNGHAGRIEFRSPTTAELAQNANYRGHVRVNDSGRHFQYADDTPLWPIADTLWSGNTARCGLGENEDGPFFQYLADRKAKGFTAILMKCLSGFGDGPANPTGDRNEGGYAFVQRDIKRLNPKYFEALDRRMEAIWSRGFIVAVPVSWWGKTSSCVFDIRGAQRISAYCAVRYGAYNGMWCLSGEYQYTFQDCGWTEESFDALGRTFQAHNPYEHPLSIHPSARLDWAPPHNCQSSRPFQHSGWLDHHWLQTGQSVDRMHNIVTRSAENRALSPTRPVFCSEAYYDVADDPDQAYHARWQVWVALLSGSAGYGYGAHGIWQFFDPGDPSGETGKKTPHAVPWEQALHNEGSTMIRPMRSLLSRQPWWSLEPHPDWLLVDGEPNLLPTATDLTPPCCAAAADRLCLVYIPRGNESRALKLVQLPGEDCVGHWYNPRNGETVPLDEPPAGQTEWQLPQRPWPADEDWILCLEKRP